MQFRIITIFLFLACFACKNDQHEKSDTITSEEETEIKFDKTKWNMKDGSTYPFRDKMLNDLVYNDTFRVLNQDEMLELLGAPDRSNEGHLYYTIAQKKLGLWPLHTKTLVIKFSEDNSVEWMKIHE